MSKENIPEFMLQFWKDSPTVYTTDDIIHLEPFSENAVFLKYLALNDSSGMEYRRFIMSDGKNFITSDDLIFKAKD